MCSGVSKLSENAKESTMPEINAVHFEGVKISMTQSSDGIVLKLAVHPDDCPASLMTDWVGSRYMVAMAKIMDDETPVSDNNEIARLKASCGALCRNEKFQTWILRDTGLDVNEQNAVDVLKEQIGIRSRSEFDTNQYARAAFNDMREEFQVWLKNSAR